MPGIHECCSGYLLIEIPGEDEDVMGFGKNYESTYLETYENDPNYVTWAMPTVKEQDCSVYLRRFAQYAAQKKAGGR